MSGHLVPSSAPRITMNIVDFRSDYSDGQYPRLRVMPLSSVGEGGYSCEFESTARKRRGLNLWPIPGPSAQPRACISFSSLRLFLTVFSQLVSIT